MKIFIYASILLKGVSAAMSEALLTLLYLAVAVEFITETLRESFPPLQRLPACLDLRRSRYLYLLSHRPGAPGPGQRRLYSLRLHRLPAHRGCLISRGAGVMHDLISAFSGLGRRLLKGI